MINWGSRDDFHIMKSAFLESKFYSGGNKMWTLIRKFMLLFSSSDRLVGLVVSMSDNSS